MNHTPANWWFAAAEDGFYVAGTGDVEMTKPIGQDQARLIAAAPELLAALIEMHQQFKDNQDYSDDDAQVIARARAAIVRATGDAR